MCWIFWYKWTNKATWILLNWLERLEYRWYDSAWIAISNEKEIKKIRSIWKIANLQEEIQKKLFDDNWYNIWIWHTRWATHWKVTIENTHPHNNQDWKIFIVHNWIIENYKEIKEELIEKWYKFLSDTDSEVIVWLLQFNKWKDLLETVENILPKLEWAYAFLVIHKDFPWQMVWVKYWSPLVFWFNKDWNFYFSSDINALWWLTEDIIYMNDWDCIFVNHNDFLIKSEWKLVIKAIEKVNTANLVSDRWDFEHFMLKEIYEQPDVIRNIFRWRLNFDTKELNSSAFYELEKLNIKNVVFIWCWTSYHAGLTWEYWFNKFTNINVSTKIASEFEYQDANINNETLYIFISQSWETADTIQVLKNIKKKWWKTMWIVNVVWSTISQLTDYWLFLRAWTEIWVASTKAFIAQISTILLISLYLWQKSKLSFQEFENIINWLETIPNLIDEILNDTKNIQNISKEIYKYNNFFYLWRSIQLPIAMESSLKLKEISYLHSEAISSWELKHWPLALIDNNFPTIIINPNDFFYKKNLSSIEEIKARNWKILWISDLEFDCDWFIKIPSTIWCLYPFLTTIIWQLISYYVSLELWREIDKPRNLAKSVTVS